MDYIRTLNSDASNGLKTLLQKSSANDIIRFNFIFYLKLIISEFINMI